MLIEIFILITMVCAFVLSVKCTKDFLHPSTILSFVYVVDIAFYLFMKVVTKSSYCLSPWVLYFSIGLYVFFFGSYFIFKNKKYEVKALVEKDSKEITLFYKIFVALQILILILYIRDIVLTSRVTERNILSYITATRSYLYNEKLYFMIPRNVSFVLSFIAIYRMLSKKTFKSDNVFLILQVIISFVYMVFMTTRTVWFLFLIPVAMIFLLTHYKDNKSFIKYGLLVFTVFFIFTLSVTILRRQSTTLDSIRCYLCSGIIQFTEWLKNQGERLNGQYTFRAFLKILKRLHLYSGELHWVDQRYLDIPGLDWSIGNVFSFYHGYAQDFGLVYAMFVQLLVGIFHGFIYYRARITEKTLWVILYSMFTNPLVLQFFSDQYAANLSLWIQMTLVAILVCNSNIFYRKMES